MVCGVTKKKRFSLLLFMFSCPSFRLVVSVIPPRYIRASQSKAFSLSVDVVFFDVVVSELGNIGSDRESGCTIVKLLDRIMIS